MLSMILLGRLDAIHEMRHWLKGLSCCAVCGAALEELQPREMIARWWQYRVTRKDCRGSFGVVNTLLSTC